MSQSTTLETPYTMSVSGQTGSGKTKWIEKLIRNQEKMHDKKFHEIIYCYSVMQDVYMDMLKDIPNLTLVEGFPNDLAQHRKNTMVVLDDMMVELEKDRRISEMFTKYRHYNISSIFITQNIYHESKYFRDVGRNSQYLTLFENPRDAQMIMTLGKQIFPKNPQFLLDAYIQATSEPFGYLFIDLKPGSDRRLMLRSNIFPDEICRVYVPK